MHRRVYSGTSTGGCITPFKFRSQITDPIPNHVIHEPTSGLTCPSMVNETPSTGSGLPNKLTTLLKKIKLKENNIEKKIKQANINFSI